MAESLLLLEFEERIDLAEELLSTPAASAAVCEAISSVGTGNPQLVDPRLIDPLVRLLDLDNPELSLTASLALSVFRVGHVSQRLGTVAADPNLAISKRMAAVGALAINTHRREAVRALIELTAVSDNIVATEAVKALQPASRSDYGPDLEAWRDWWKDKEELSTAAWLQDRLDLAAQQNRTIHSEITELRFTTRRRQELVSHRMDQLLRRVYQLTSQQAQREILIQQWLADSMEDYRLCALHLVRERIAEGDTPADEVRSAVKRCFSDSAASIRVAALEIVGNLRNTEDANDVLKSLPMMRDPLVRETALRILGRLENPVAIDTLVAELTDEATPPGCIREAAVALGALAAQGRLDAERIAPAIKPLKRRFEKAAEDAVRLREALLSAMASIGDDAFQPEFVGNLSSASPELLLAAIRGIETIGSTMYLDAVLSHLSHADPRVRQLAAKAVGALGSADAHLQALITKLHPDEETNEGVRNAAWDGFRAILFRMPASSRIDWVEHRLDHLPDRQVILLEQLIDEMAAYAPAQDITAARSKLADILLNQQKYAEAIPHLQQLRKSYIADNQSDAAVAAGVGLIRAYLVSGRHDQLGPLVTDVLLAADTHQRSAVSREVFEYCRKTLTQGDSVALKTLLEQMAALPENLQDSDWKLKLQELSERILLIEDAQPAPQDP